MFELPAEELSEIIKDFRNIIPRLLAKYKTNAHSFSELDIAIHCENYLSLLALQACFEKETIDLIELERELRLVLAKRWDIIAHTCCDYSQNPYNTVNILCSLLALFLAPFPEKEEDLSKLGTGDGPYFILMPTLENHQSLVTMETIHELDLWAFTTSDDKKRFIPIDSCFEYAKTSEAGVFRHLVSLPGETEAPLLTDSELKRLMVNSDLAKDYYKAILSYHATRLRPKPEDTEKFLAAQLTKLMQALRRGGAKASGRGHGREFDSGAAANEGIVAFSLYWQSLGEDREQAIKQKYPELAELLNNLFRTKESDGNDPIHCVQEISKDLSLIVDRMNPDAVLEAYTAAFQAELQSRDYVTSMSDTPPKLLWNPHFLTLYSLESLVFYALLNQPDWLEHLEPIPSSIKKLLLEGHTEDNQSLLLAAVIRGQLFSVSTILQWTEDLNLLIEDEAMALRHAAVRGYTDILFSMLDFDLYSPYILLYALYNQQWELVIKLIHWDEEQYKQQGEYTQSLQLLEDSYAITVGGDSALMLAVNADQEEAVAHILQRGCYESLAANEKHNTVLCLAAQRGHIAILRWLLSNKDFLATLDLPGEEGLTPLEWAQRKGHQAAVELLNQAKVASQLPLQEETQSQSAVWLGVFSNSLKNNSKSTINLSAQPFSLRE